MERKQICKRCGNWQVRIDAYDSYACIFCDEWKESTCSDRKCQFCSSRPAKPSMSSAQALSDPNNT